MAKRKRLTPANPAYLDEGRAPEHKSIGPLGAGAPIANVASDAAATAALEEISREFAAARDEGRLVITLELAQIELEYLVRDRVPVEDDEMEALVASIRARGQQTPVEVTETGPGRYGLISGWRRCQAITQLQAEGQGDGLVRALLRRPEDAADAYQSMVEENEIRVGLSYFERARIVAKAVDQGVFDRHKTALQSLFSTASRAKRSKIGSFLSVVFALDGTLRFPQTIGERLGLQLARRLDEDPDFAHNLQTRLTALAPATSVEEQEILAAAIQEALQKETLTPALETNSKSADPQRATYSERELRPGLMVRVDRQDGRVQIWGEALTPSLRGQLLTWLERQK